MSTSPSRLEGQGRERLIAWLLHRMEEFGITIDALERSLAEDQCKVHVVLYQDATGHTWDGNGDLPDWLRRAVAAGQSIEHFRCDARPGATQ
jgi:DNA-binding protein H-NS